MRYCPPSLDFGPDPFEVAESSSAKLRTSIWSVVVSTLICLAASDTAKSAAYAVSSRRAARAAATISWSALPLPPLPFLRRPPSVRFPHPAGKAAPQFRRAAGSHPRLPSAPPALPSESKLFDRETTQADSSLIPTRSRRRRSQNSAARSANTHAQG